MTPAIETPHATVYCGDALAVLRELPSGSVHMIVTSPPFFTLRDYGVAGQIGMEATPEAWRDALVGVFREARRVLRSDGTLWVECGDSYAVGGRGGGGPKQATNIASVLLGPAKAPPGYKAKDLIGQAWLLGSGSFRVAGGRESRK